ncbi:GTPase HflX [Aquibacillus koreensis]|uniref:GTPase HflX n=2 Tax=Aquibacillus koreensis TaxID=279446 RepID=A0A9X3WLY2_9BACI|nr:GTPase HflX [Aquibacillus koreensis]MCT2536406.1 GTPase HflX [Aquibacillus koreensis]MDC3421243.1 GTPase HflX [Aquibacillus koreensis]
MEEKVLIIAVHHSGYDEQRLQFSIEELQSLTETAKGSVLKVVTQKREKIHRALYMGEGKIEEIREMVEELEIDLVISNDELSAGQMRNLNERLGVRIIDRSQLILDIFAQRANTKEGKLQVELAQYQYMLPRLHGQGQALSRLGGGIGTRGPGETKLESDRRHIRRRIDEIKRRLTTVVNQREQYRKRRRENRAFQIAIVGYTNAGKSTIFNRLTQSTSLEENQLFATLDPMSRQLRLPSGLQTIITDTVGFIQDLPTSLIAAFRSTLEEVTEADFILHMIDASHPDQVQHQKTVLKLLEDLNAQNIPMLTVYNKEDLIMEEFIPHAHPFIKISAYKENDLDKVLKKIEEMITESWEGYRTIVPESQGKLLQQLKQYTIIQEQQYEEELEGYTVKGYIAHDHPLKNGMKES